RLRARLNRRRLGTLTAGAGAAALLSACAGGRGAGPAPPSTAGLPSRPRTGGTLNLQLIADFFDFDSSLGGKTVPNPNATTLAYDSLLGFQQGPGVDYEKTTIIGNLATKWETPDAATFTFHLGPGLKFSSAAPLNGCALTSADVKWSFEYASRTGALKGTKLPQGQFGYMFEGLQGIEAPDDTTIVVRFATPFAPFLSYATTYGTQIVPHEIYDQDGSFSKQIAGCGPMQLDVSGSQHGSRWTFKRNPGYLVSGQPYLDGANYLVFKDMETMYAAFQTHQLDILKAVVDHDVKSVVAANPNAVRQQALDPNSQGLYMSATHPPFNDMRVRQAVALAINRDEFDKTLGAGEGDWPMPAATPDLWSASETKQILRYDPQQAKKLLADAGYPNGLKIDLMFASGKDDATEAQLLQAQLKAAGIDLAIQQVDAATKSSREHGADYTMDMHAFPIFGDLDSRLYGSYHSKGTANQQRINDPKLDTLIDAQRREPDATKRRDLLRAATKYIAENAVDVSMFRQTINTFWQPYVKNYADNWQQYNFNIPNVWVEK
ncbi:MAG TPA: ABC transporter substrate-binding protein, partial [Dehalococcoidia bacterium]|nr:ABC transporter substrate-binding protein [Dehalococcoidia bacterium]